MDGPWYLKETFFAKQLDEFGMEIWVQAQWLTSSVQQQKEEYGI